MDSIITSYTITNSKEGQKLEFVFNHENQTWYVTIFTLIDEKWRERCYEFNVGDAINLIEFFETTVNLYE